MAKSKLCREGKAGRKVKCSRDKKREVYAATLGRHCKIRFVRAELAADFVLRPCHFGTYSAAGRVLIGGPRICEEAVGH